MVREREHVAEQETARKRFLDLFKNTLVNYGIETWKRVKDKPAEELYWERKNMKPDLTEREFVENWVSRPSIGQGTAFDIGVAFGEMIAEEKYPG